MIYIRPYRRGSKSCKALVQAAPDTIRTLKAGTRVIIDKDVIVNWGAIQSLGDVPKELRVLNRPENVRVASNKKMFFETMNRLYPELIPPFWTNKDDVPLTETIVCRTVLNGHSGEGIVLYDPDAEVPLPNCELYVQYIPKKWEFRVHATKGEAFMVRRKARDRNNLNPNWKIRNHQNGFIFVQTLDDILPSVVEHIKELACTAIVALDLDFGAVDIIYSTKEHRGWVLEVNTAPGLEGSSVQTYVETIQKLAS